MNFSSQKHAAIPASACSPPDGFNHHGNVRRRRSRKVLKRYSSTCSESGKRPKERPRRVKKCKNRPKDNMGCTSSKKKSVQDSDENDVWKKRDDVIVEIGENKKRKKRGKKKKKKNTSDDVKNQENVNEHSVTIIPSQGRVTENAPCPVYATPTRKHKDVLTNTGIKMADDSSSSSPSCATPVATPTTRRAHPVFKVATPPPPRRALQTETVQIPPQHGILISPPSPPARNQTSIPEAFRQNMTTSSQPMAPELPPRRNREHSKISSPSLSRKNKEYVVKKLPSPVIMRQHEESPKSSPSFSRKLDKQTPASPPPKIQNETQNTAQNYKRPEVDATAVLVTTSPVLMRKTGRIEFINTSSPIPKRKFSDSKDKNGQVKMKDNIPPLVSKPSPILVRKMQAELKDSPRQGKKTYDRAPTPPPRLVRSDSKPETPEVSSPNTRRAYPVFKVTTPPPARKDISDSGSKSAKTKHDKKTVTSPAPKENIDKIAPKYGGFKECEPMKCDDDTGRVVKREIKTLSMEIEEENLRNMMREMSAKDAMSSKPKSNVATMNIMPGPILVKECIIPPPERAVISGPPPPPSPSSMDILEEDEEEDDDIDDVVKSRLSKEVEEFGGSVCQRLSALLESKDIIFEQNSFENGVNLGEESSMKGVEFQEEIKSETAIGREASNNEKKVVLMDVTNNNVVPDQEASLSTNDNNAMKSCISPPSDSERKLIGFDYKSYTHDLAPRKRSFPQFEAPPEFRDSYVPPKKEITKNREMNPVEEDQIVPMEIKRKSLIETLQPLRDSDILCDIISGYAEPEVKEPEVVVEQLVSKETVRLQREAPVFEDKQPSRLDQSIQKIFKMPKMDETYNELLPLENFLEDVLDASPDQDNYYPTFDSSDVLYVKKYRHIGGRQSMTRTESDIEFSEPGDDMSTGSMLADDEDELGSGEIIFSKEFPDTRQEAEEVTRNEEHGPLREHRRRISRKSEEFDDNFWEEDDDESDYEEYSDEESEDLSSEEDEYYNDYIDDEDQMEDEKIRTRKAVVDVATGTDSYRADPGAVKHTAVDTKIDDENSYAYSDYDDEYIQEESGACALQIVPEPEVRLSPSYDSKHPDAEMRLSPSYDSKLQPDLKVRLSPSFDAKKPDPEVRLSPSYETKRHSPREFLNFDFLTFEPHSQPDAGDIAYDSARRQMNEIHEHLQNLRDQMELLAHECEEQNLRPSLVLEAEVENRRRSKDATE